MVLPETARSSAPLLEAAIWEERATGASGTRLKVATRPAAVGTTWLDLFHPGTPSELTLEARVRVVADVAGALIQIHENSGVPRPHRRHGRLTPRHVLVSVDGSASLFNVKEPFSKLLPPQPDLGYLAPELLTQSGPSTQQSDVFGLGVLLWEALDNGRLFPHRRAEAISRLIARRSLPSPRATEEWALPLSEVALRALLPDPGERHADATAFWLALREHLPAPDGARGVLSRLVQQALKLELTSEIRESPPYLVPNRFPGATQPPADAQLGPESVEAPARYSLHPEPSSRRVTISLPPSFSMAPGGLAQHDPAWLLSDPPAISPSLAAGPNRSLAPVSPSSVAPHASEPSAASSLPPPAFSPASLPPESHIEPVRHSRAPSSEAPLSPLQVNLQREVVDGAIPFFVTSPPVPRPFPWGALSFAALIFFGVGAAVAFGAVTALRAPRSEPTSESGGPVSLPATPNWGKPEKPAPALDTGKHSDPAPSNAGALDPPIPPRPEAAAEQPPKVVAPLPPPERAGTPPISEATLTTGANKDPEAADVAFNTPRPATPHRMAKPVPVKTVKHKHPALPAPSSTPSSSPDGDTAETASPEAPPVPEPSSTGSDLTESLPFVKQPY